MPMYRYRCIDKHEFDERVPMDQRDKGQVCPVCGRGAVKIFTPTNFVFRGALMSEDAPPGAGRKTNSTI